MANVEYSMELRNEEQEDLVIGKDGGKKCDKEKIRMDLIPLDAMKLIAEIMTFGANKYEANNWKKVEVDRYHAALLRHLEAWQRGERLDDEWNLTHLAHMACNAIFMLWIEECK